MEGKWTKGPWFVDERKHNCGSHTLTCVDIGTDPDSPYRGRVCSAQSAEHIDGMPGEEVRANAALIAQAPAMAEALEKLVEEYRSIWMGEGGGADACEHILAPYRALLTAIKGE